MDHPLDLAAHPIHLGVGATAVVQPVFTGDMAWYQGYSERNNGDGPEGRLVSMSALDGAWDHWEMHPNGTEVVLCVSGELELVQEVDGEQVVQRVTEGQYVINPPGIWHTANDTGPCSALFITAGEGTQHRPR